jgi:hypothetical protein
MRIGRSDGGPEGPCPLPISLFPITNFEFSRYQFGYFSFPILSFLITNYQFGYFPLPIWLFLSTKLSFFYLLNWTCGYLLLSKFTLEHTAEHSSVDILGPKGSRRALQTQDNSGLYMYM